MKTHCWHSTSCSRLNDSSGLIPYRQKETVAHKPLTTAVNRWYTSACPLIGIDYQGNIKEIHVNNRSMSPPEIAEDKITSFYEAYQLFCKKMEEPESQMKFYLKEGDYVAFNNRRVLHGRTAFDATRVNRYLKGCYTDFDEILTCYDKITYMEQGTIKSP
ncbi:uncharacterized protein LOC111085868 [Limulus polyphemus]|uniref:Uncharacterized protein LOC111085868 n=1 Tax=Limulus polyphemus TaxID=6850 RepID=A0ABM1SET8_LIMPO|nr:uncharacterized protein LOC111085868 [Limulus polyphemus]